MENKLKLHARVKIGSTGETGTVVVIAGLNTGERIWGINLDNPRPVSGPLVYVRHRPAPILGPVYFSDEVEILPRPETGKKQRATRK